MHPQLQPFVKGKAARNLLQDYVLLMIQLQTFKLEYFKVSSQECFEKQTAKVAQLTLKDWQRGAEAYTFMENDKTNRNYRVINTFNALLFL